MTTASFRQAHGSKPRRIVRVDDPAGLLALEHDLDPEHVIDVHLIGPHYVFRVWSCTADGAERYEDGQRVWHTVSHPRKART